MRCPRAGAIRVVPRSMPSPLEKQGAGAFFSALPSRPLPPFPIPSRYGGEAVTAPVPEPLVCGAALFSLDSRPCIRYISIYKGAIS